MHIGKKIEEVVRAQGRSPSWLARELNMVRVNVYSIFRRESVDTALLMKLSKILGVDFFKYISENLSEDDTKPK